jgi:hypothetical protein
MNVSDFSLGFIIFLAIFYFVCEVAKWERIQRRLDEHARKQSARNAVPRVMACGSRDGVSLSKVSHLDVPRTQRSFPPGFSARELYRTGSVHRAVEPGAMVAEESCSLVGDRGTGGICADEQFENRGSNRVPLTE